MALVRQPVQGLRSLLEADSVVDAMTANLLASTGRGPSPGEVRSWRASLPVLVNDVIAAGLPNVEILVEHQLPLTSRRVDAILAGHHPKTKEPSYVLVELKQWGSAENYDDAPGLVRLDAYGHRPVLHPIEQVDGYRQYLLDFLPALAEQPSAVAAIAYLHNATEHGIQDLRDRAPTDLVRLFSGERKQDLYDFLRQRLDPEIPGTQSADLLMGMRAGPSRQLLAVAADEIRDREQFVLLDEQRVAYEIVMHAVRQAHAADNKTVVIVTGGPGTGKSVIAPVSYTHLTLPTKA